MKSLKSFILLVMVFISVCAIAQQNTSKTVILSKSFCQYYNSVKTTSFTIDFQLSGLDNLAIENFKTKVSNTEGVINFAFIPSHTGLKNIKVELYKQADFEFIKNLFKENDILFVNDEEINIPIDKWTPFNSDQCQQIFVLNQNISNVELKFNYVKEDPNRSQADKDLYLEKNANTLTMVLQNKKDYLNSLGLNK
jgi:hypothetical protein